MSDLTVFRDHCKRMQAAEHTPACATRLLTWIDRDTARRWFDIPDPGPRPECDGACITAEDRELWARLAAEVDDYLAPQPDLFGELTPEPNLEEKTP